MKLVDSFEFLNFSGFSNIQQILSFKESTTNKIVKLSIEWRIFYFTYQFFL